MIRALLAIFLPCILFLTIGKPGQAIICLILQLTILGWLPATLWAFYGLNEWNNQQRYKQMIRNDWRYP